VPELDAAVAETAPFPAFAVEAPWVAKDDPSLVVLAWRRPDLLNSSYDTTAVQATGSFGSGAECSFSAGAGRLEARADPLGYGALFVWEGRGVAAISTRIEVLAQLAHGLGEAVHKSRSSAEGLAHVGFVVPGVTGYDEVRGLDPDEVASIAGGRLHIGPNPDAIEWDRSGAKPTLPDLIEGTAAALVASVERAVTSTEETVVDLTAGYDSHLILGALMRAGHASEVGFQTIGGDDLHDVVVARARTAQLGLRHRSGFPYQPSSADLWTRFVANARLTGGLNNPKDGLREDLPQVSHYRVSGLFGELLRGWRTHASRTTPARDLTDRITQAFGAGRLSLLRGEAEERAERAMAAEIVDSSDPERPAWLGMHRFYARDRLRSRALRLDDAVPESRHYPLYTKELVEFGLDAMWHHPDAPFGDLLLEHLDPSLTEPPPPVVDGLGGLPAVEPAPGTTKPATLMQHGLAQQQGERGALFAKVAEVDSEAWEVLDHAAFQAAVESYGDLTHPQLSLLHGAANAVIWMSDLVDPPAG